MFKALEVSEIQKTEDDIEREATCDSKWPCSIWKIARCERPKFLCMGSMFTLIAFIYSFLYVTKDVVVSERQLPASIIFLKAYYVMPLSAIFILLIQYLTKITKIEKVLRYAVLCFGVYFIIYSFVLLKYQEKLEPNPFWASDFFGDGKMNFRGLEAVFALFLTINFWTSSLLYITSELWGSLIVSLLFMGFSNDICNFKQSIRFTPLLFIFSNLGLLLSGLLMYHLAHEYENGPYKFKELFYKGVFLGAGIISFIIICIQYYLEKFILPYPIFIIKEEKKTKKTKAQIDIIKGLAFVSKSFLLLNMFYIMIAYNICMSFVDSLFKTAMKEYAITTGKDVGSSVMRFEAENQILVSICVIILLSTPFSQLMHKFNWKVTGFVTPVSVIISCIFVNVFAIYNTGCKRTNAFHWINIWFGDKNTMMLYEMKIGQLASSILKITKYAAFDIAKEALSMKIAKEHRIIAKSIFDGVCGKLGKAIGGTTSAILNLSLETNDIRNASFILFLITIVLSVIWCYSVIYIGNKYNEAFKKKTDIDLDIL